MAPVQSRTLRNEKPLKSILKSSTTTTPTSSTKQVSSFPTSKKDKRQIKHSQFISKISKSTATSKRRRRPHKKLVTTLNELVDALPDQDHDTDQTNQPELQAHIIKRTSTKSRPGALRRRQQEDNAERARFAKNMAQLTRGGSTGQTNTPNPVDPTASSTTDRWTALRGFIAQTLEKRS